MIVYYAVNEMEIGIGFITHEDIEENGLSFCVTGIIIQVIGEEADINTWNSRNNLTQVDSAIAEQYIEHFNEIVINE